MGVRGSTRPYRALRGLAVAQTCRCACCRTSLGSAQRAGRALPGSRVARVVALVLAIPDRSAVVHPPQGAVVARHLPRPGCREPTVNLEVPVDQACPSPKLALWPRYGEARVRAGVCSNRRGTTRHSIASGRRDPRVGDYARRTGRGRDSDSVQHHAAAGPTSPARFWVG
jgi:hypothetical protein